MPPFSGSQVGKKVGKKVSQKKSRRDMQIDSFPQEIHHGIIECLDGDDLLHLSLSNRYFYEFLSSFRLLAACIKREYHESYMWPVAILSKETIRTGCSITDCLQQLKLEQFNFTDIFINTEIGSKLADVIPQSKSYDVAVINGIKKSQFDTILGHRNLKTIAFDAGNPMIPLFIPILENIRNLAALRLSGLDESNFIQLVKHLPDSNICKLAIMEVDSKFNTRCHSSLFSVLHLTKLTKLSMCECRLNDESAVKLAKALPNTKLNTLELNCNQITDVGVIVISKVLRYTQLCTLELLLNGITITGFTALAASFPHSKLTAFDVSKNPVKKCEIEYHVLTNLANSNIEYVWITQNEERFYVLLIENISKSNLKSITLRIPYKFLKGFLIAAQSSKLEEMNIQGYGGLFSDESAVALAKHIDKLPVKRIVFNGSVIGPHGLASILRNLTKTSKLKHLELSSSLVKIDKFRNIGELLTDTSLRSLKITNAEWNDSTLESLVQGVNGSLLRHLDLSYNNFTPSAILEFVSRVRKSKLFKLEFKNIIRDNQLRKRTMLQILDLVDGNYNLNVLI
ncbi:hypothetical protein HDV01_007088 [Terramyces sp. JEL0728]|nr:hypothetical protein HDV01_007088 [Terramyces sp. JEL0728]